MTPYHAKIWAHELTRRAPADSVDRLATALVDAQVDLNPHQVDAALFAFRSPLSKARNQLASAEVLAKKEAAELWCQRASEHTKKHGGKPWKYALVPHDVVDENMSLEFLVRAGVSA